MTTRTEALQSDTIEAQSLNLPPAKLNQTFKFYRNSTFISLMLGYGGYYLCRQNLGAAFGPMKDSLGLSTLQLGWISTIGTFMYAVGKFVAAPLADSKVGGRFVFFFGLFSSSAFCFLFGFGKGMSFYILAWSMCRLCQSAGWSGLVNVLSRWFPSESYGTAMGLMSASYQFGGGLVTLFAGLILSWGGNWQSLFYIPSLTLIAIGILIYPFLKQSPQDLGLASPHSNSSAIHERISSKIEVEPERSYIQRFLFLLSKPAFLGMLTLSFILTFLRECFNIWMPIYFSSMGESASAAALKSTVFPFLGCIGTLLGGYASDRYFNGRRAPMMALLMTVLIGCLAAIGSLDRITTAIQPFTHHITRSEVATVLVGAIGFFLLGSYSFIGGVVALDFGGQKVSGTAAGLLDGVGYLGATLAGVCIAQLVVHHGWNYTFFLMSGCIGLGIIITLMLWNVEPRKEKENA